MGLQDYTQDVSRITLKYHLITLCYTRYTHPMLICRGTDTRTDRRTENIYSIFRDKLLLLGEHVLICFPWAYSSSLTQSYPHFLAQFFGFWVTCGFKMMSLHHGHSWGWPPPQTASLIHIRHIQRVWAHWYAVHGHKMAALLLNLLYKRTYSKPTIG